MHIWSELYRLFFLEAHQDFGVLVTDITYIISRLMVSASPGNKEKSLGLTKNKFVRPSQK